MNDVILCTTIFYILSTGFTKAEYNNDYFEL